MYFSVIILLLLLFSPVTSFSMLTETIDNSCPSDPTQGGKCVLESETTDGPSEKIIGGVAVARDWWRKDFNYKCSGGFDADTFLTKVGTNFCEYKNDCVEWGDIKEDGGTATCKVYIDRKRPNCSSPPYSYDCMVNECEDLFKTCQQKHYVKYSAITDPLNVTGDINCDTETWTCGAETQVEKSGIKVGIYTFECPEGVRKVCNKYEGVMRCPCSDGSKCPANGICPDGNSCVNQACSKVKTCKEQKTVETTEWKMQSCSAARNYQTYSYAKCLYNKWPEKCAADGIGVEADVLRNNDLCVKSGESDGCMPGSGCTDADSYGEGFFTKNGPDWGYVTLKGLDPVAKTFSLHAYAAGGMGHCGDLKITFPIDTPVGTVIGSVYPNWETGSCSEATVKFKGYDCTGGCVYTFSFHSDLLQSMGGTSTFIVNVPVAKVNEDFICYENSYQECTFEGVAECTKLSSVDINSLECLEYVLDHDDPKKALCKNYRLGYDCPKTVTNTECNLFEEVIQCSNALFGPDNLHIESADNNNDFLHAMSIAQAANELKHIWSGEPYVCESGLWWLFDTMSFGDYLQSKIMSMAMQYLGSSLMSFTGVSSALSEGLGCMNSVMEGALVNAAGPAVVSTSVSMNNPNNSAAGITVTNQLQDGSAITSNIDTSKSQGCVAAIGQKLGGAVGLSTGQIAQITNFFSNTYVLIALGVLMDVVTSLKDCSTCDDEECATKYGQYKEYVLIKNRMCHFVASECTSKLLVGCARTGYRYCCYNSLFARVLMEQSFKQLDRSFGDYDAPNCTGLTLMDLKCTVANKDKPECLGRNKYLDFDTMDFKEFVSYIKAKMKKKLKGDIDSLSDVIKGKITNP